MLTIDGNWKDAFYGKRNLEVYSKLYTAQHWERKKSIHSYKPDPGIRNWGNYVQCSNVYSVVCGVVDWKFTSSTHFYETFKLKCCKSNIKIKCLKF